MILKNLLTLLTSIIITLCLAEFVVGHFTRLGTFESKIEATVDEPKCYANCYSTNPKGYFPVTLKVSKDLAMYCLPYACQARKKGFFSNRTEEVFLVGDSFTFGEGVNEKDSLGYILGERFDRYNFRNFGETAADIKRVRAIVSQLLADPQEKVKRIVYFYNLNDVNMSPELASRQAYINDFENIRWSNVGKVGGSFDLFMSRFALYRIIKKIYVLRRESDMTVRNYLDMYLSPINAIEMQESMNDLVAIGDLARQKEVDLTVIVYPLLYKQMGGVYPFAPIHGVLMDVCKKHQINCIDGYQAFVRYPSLKPFTVHPVDFHPNGDANRVLADYLLLNKEQLRGI